MELFSEILDYNPLCFVYQFFLITKEISLSILERSSLKTVVIKIFQSQSPTVLCESVTSYKENILHVALRAKAFCLFFSPFAPCIFSLFLAQSFLKAHDSSKLKTQKAKTTVFPLQEVHPSTTLSWVFLHFFLQYFSVYVKVYCLWNFIMFSSLTYHFTSVFYIILNKKE